MEVIRDYYAAVYTSGASTMTIQLSPVPGSETHPADLPVLQINVVQNAAVNSCQRFWGVSGNCSRFQVCISRIS